MTRTQQFNFYKLILFKRNLNGVIDV